MEPKPIGEAVKLRMKTDRFGPPFDPISGVNPVLGSFRVDHPRVDRFDQHKR